LFVLQTELNEFKHSVEMLSHAVPNLTQLNIRAHNISLRTIESFDYLNFFQISFKVLLKTYFKRLKIFELW